MLLVNEKINFGEEEISSVQYNDEKINAKYISGDVRIVTEQARYPLDTINMMIDSGNYELNPDFQRRRRWNNEKKSKLIESFIMNVPIPPIFLYENDFSHYEVMDGLQRLTTIYDFYTDKFELEGLQLWRELNGRTYSSLPEKVKKGIDRRYLSSIILLQESAKNDEEAMRMKQLVFERINSGGVQLEPQETRNALYDGNMNQLCIKLSRNHYLCKFLKIPFDGDIESEDRISDDLSEKLNNNEIYKQMQDVEYVLRFFAMRQLEGYGKRKLKDYLDFYLREANKFSESLLEELKKIFNETIKLAYDIFGEKAFYMYRRRVKDNGENWNWFARTTTTIYDPLMQCLSNLLPYKETLIKQRENICNDIMLFYQENYTDFEGRSNNKADIIKRIEKLDDFLKKYIMN